MRSLNKVFFPVLVIAAAVAIALFSAACEVGLGEAIDANPPSVTIDYPPTGAIIREDFLLAGTTADDTGVRSVSVSLVNTDTNESYGAPNAVLHGESWSVPLNVQTEVVGGGLSTRILTAPTKSPLPRPTPQAEPRPQKNQSA
jgi:hypothetical protein